MSVCERLHHWLGLRTRGRARRRGRGRVVGVLQFSVEATVGTRRRGRGARRGARALALALLLLHAPVLKPDFHLSLVQLERGRDLDAPCPRQVLAEVKLLLQLRQLARAEVSADGVVRARESEVRHFSCREEKTNVKEHSFVFRWCPRQPDLCACFSIRLFANLYFYTVFHFKHVLLLRIVVGTFTEFIYLYRGMCFIYCDYRVICSGLNHQAASGTTWISLSGLKLSPDQHVADHKEKRPRRGENKGCSFKR